VSGLELDKDLGYPFTQRFAHFSTISVLMTWNSNLKQETQLMLTNPRDAFRGQSRSPNILPFHMLGILRHPRLPINVP